MNQSELFMQVVTSGETISTKTLETNDPQHYYTLHTFYVLGGYDKLTTLTLNGVSNIIFGGTTKYDTTPIVSLTINTSQNGVLVIGRKTKKTIF